MLPLCPVSWKLPWPDSAGQDAVFARPPAQSRSDVLINLATLCWPTALRRCSTRFAGSRRQCFDALHFISKCCRTVGEAQVLGTDWNDLQLKSVKTLWDGKLGGRWLHHLGNYVVLGICAPSRRAEPRSVQRNPCPVSGCSPVNGNRRGKKLQGTVCGGKTSQDPKL